MGIESIVFVKPKGVGNDTKSGGNRTESLTLDMKELKRPESKRTDEACRIQGHTRVVA